MYCRTETFTIYAFAQDKEAIDFSAEYQRNADAWDIKKQQLFLDSLFNEYDVAKIYLHELPKNDDLIYAMVDGKQRLQCIYDFLDGKISLAKDFIIKTSDPFAQKQKPNPTGGDTFNDLSEFWQVQFKSTCLDVAVIREATAQDIAAMFIRLNEHKAA